MDRRSRFSGYHKEYDHLLSLLWKLGGKILFSEIEVGVEGFYGLLGLVAVTLEKEEEALLVEDLTIVVDLVLGHIVVELVQLLPLVFIMLDLAEEEEAGALLAFFCLLLLLYMAHSLRVGKKR
jgi:hypothetical protein